MTELSRWVLNRAKVDPGISVVSEALARTVEELEEKVEHLAREVAEYHLGTCFAEQPCPRCESARAVLAEAESSDD